VVVNPDPHLPLAETAQMILIGSAADEARFFKRYVR
jgi:hypothetical protein